MFGSGLGKFGGAGALEGRGDGGGDGGDFGGDALEIEVDGAGHALLEIDGDAADVDVDLEEGAVGAEVEGVVEGEGEGGLGGEGEGLVGSGK